MPDDTPAAVMTLPRSTTRSSVGVAPSARSRRRRPSASWHRDRRARRHARGRSNRCTRSSSTSSSGARPGSSARPGDRSVAARSPNPPGTTITSGAVTSSNDAVATIERRPVWSRTGPFVSATKTASTPGRSARVWKGPTMSRAVNCGIEGEGDLHGLHPAGAPATAARTGCGRIRTRPRAGTRWRGTAPRHQAPPPMKAFERETGVVRDESRPDELVYRGELSEEWTALDVPQGGIVMGVAARAMAAAIDAPAMTLRSITSVFAAPVRTGPVEIDVQVLRRGRSVAQATATVRNDGAAAGTTSVAVFGAPRDGFEFVDLVIPEAPPPRRVARRSVTARRRVSTTETSAPYWAAPRRGSGRGRARIVGGLGADHLRAGLLVPLRRAAAPRGRPARPARAPRRCATRCRARSASAWAAGCRSGGRRARTSPSTSSTITGPSGCSRATVRTTPATGTRRCRSSSGIRTTARSCAYGTQMMIFTFPDGPPPPELRVPRDLR